MVSIVWSIPGGQYNIETTKIRRNKKYVLSNSESVQCNFFIFDHVTFTQFKICCCVQNFVKIGWFLTDIMAIYRFSKWRPSAILGLFYHHTRPPTKSLLLAAAAWQISCQSDTQIWRYSYLNFFAYLAWNAYSSPQNEDFGGLQTDTHGQIYILSMHSIGQTINNLKFQEPRTYTRPAIGTLFEVNRGQTDRQTDRQTDGPTQNHNMTRLKQHRGSGCWNTTWAWDIAISAASA